MKTEIIRAAIILTGSITIFGCKPGDHPKQVQPTNSVSSVEPEQKPPDPAMIAFGWKLGDMLPENLWPQIKDRNYDFKPNFEMPPFCQSNNCSFYLTLTPSNQIAQVSTIALNVPPDDVYDDKRRLVAFLSDKYGLISHNPNEASDGDAYYFGTQYHEVHLAIADSGVWKLDFCDETLYQIVCDEYSSNLKKDDAEKMSSYTNQFQ